MNVIITVSIAFILSVGCASNRSEVVPATDSSSAGSGDLHPVVIVLPLVAQDSVFGGVWDPEVVPRAELDRFLDQVLPAVADVPADKTVWAVLSEVTGKPIHWVRGAHMGSVKPTESVETIKYRGINWQRPRPAVRDALDVILAAANRDLINWDRSDDLLFKNYAVVARYEILILSLPVDKPRR